MSFLLLTAIFLASAVIAVPLARRLGLGAVIGYLAAGIAIGPGGLGLVEDVDSLLHFAEFGVVLLLFIIGLELAPARLWSMRRSVFGVGAVQVLVTAALLAGAARFFGLPWPGAIVVGLALSLSSTAFALQILAERNQLTTRHGRAAFSILLFQDLAVIPMLALIPLLAPYGGPEEAFTWLGAAKVLAVLALIVVGERYVLRYALRIIARTGIHEIFTASALLTVIGTALLVEQVGLSMALGAFLAGVLLADSEYRHELEADIEPFKGLLLGLFFMAVGMSVNLGLIAERPLVILGLAFGLILVKAPVLLVLGRLNRLKGSALGLAAVLPQGGEFAFVIFTVATDARVLASEVAELLIVVVTLSMAATPLLVALAEAWQARGAIRPAEPAEMPAGEDHPVIIAGFGRFGQIIGRLLSAKKIGFTAFENSPEQVDFVRRYGARLYYGDASRLDLLRAARADRAKVFVLAMGDVKASLKTAEVVRKHFPGLKILARARDRKHAYRLMDLGITVIRRETFLSSLDLGREVLIGLGLSPSESERAVRTFKEHDERRLREHHEMHKDEDRMIYLAKKAEEELEEMFEQDARTPVA